MGRVKDMAMALESQWYEKADYWAGCCEVFAQFVHEMHFFRHMMKHYSVQEYDEILNEVWHEKWSKYQ